MARSSGSQTLGGQGSVRVGLGCAAHGEGSLDWTWAWGPVLPPLPGMMLGGGCGQELAHWIIHGRPEKDMYGYDIRQVLPPGPQAGPAVPGWGGEKVGTLQEGAVPGSQEPSWRRQQGGRKGRRLPAAAAESGGHWLWQIHGPSRFPGLLSRPLPDPLSLAAGPHGHFAHGKTEACGAGGQG